MASKSVEEYVAGLEGWKGDVAGQLRMIVLAAAPKAG